MRTFKFGQLPLQEYAAEDGKNPEEKVQTSA